MALFGGACFANRKMAYLLPMAAMLLSDLVLGFTRYGLWSLLAIQPVVYACILATTALGQLIKDRRSVWQVGAATLAGSLLFFVVTNFAVWATRAPVPADGIGPGGLLRGGDPVLPEQPRGRRRLHGDPVRRAGDAGESAGVDAREAPRRCRHSARRSHARRFLAGQRHGDRLRPRARASGSSAGRTNATTRRGWRGCRTAPGRRSTSRCRAGGSTRKSGAG